jgi:predicted enzyme related to lactoylglutathione lyase
MTNVTKHKPGSFCWIELATTDQKAAKQFYESLFGWAADDMPMGPGEFYTIFKLQGRDAAAACQLRPEQTAQKVPPHWNLYIQVDSADDAVRRVSGAGGKTLAPAFDVGDFGRMAVFQDPLGATFSIWQPGQNSGTQIANVDGTLCWADLNTPDPAHARKFYSDVFGWQMTDDTDDDPPSGYIHIVNAGDPIGGIPPVRPNNPRTPAHWMAYFQTSNCDATAAKARQLGARFYLEPMTMENVGRFGVLADPQGAVFAIFQSMRK